MAEFIKTPFCVWRICKRCGNNMGGACAYSHEAEAKELGIKESELVSEDRCLLFDPLEDPAEEYEY